MIEDPIDELNELDKMGYSSKIAEENKNAGVELDKYRFKQALDTINGKTTSMKVLSALTNYTGIFWPIGKLIQWRMKKSAQNTLMEIRAHHQSRLEQNANDKEREKNLEEAGKKIEQENAQNNPENENDKDKDAEYKQWQGGRGFDIVSHSQILAKSDDELKLNTFKEDVIKRVEEDLKEEHKAAEEELTAAKENLDKYVNENLLALDALQNLSNGNTDAYVQRINSVVEVQEEIANLEKSLEEDRQQLADQSKRISEIPGEIKKINKEVEKYQKRIDENKAEHTRLKELYDLSKKNYESKKEAFDKAEREYFDISFDEKGEIKKTPAPKGSEAEKVYLDAQAALKEAKKHYEFFGDEFLPLDKKMRINTVNIRGAKDRINELTNLQATYEESTESLKARIEANETLLEIKQAVDKENRENFRSYDELVEATKAVTAARKHIEEVEKNQQNIKRDVLDARLDKVMLKNMADSIQCVSVNGRLYLNREDLKAKGFEEGKEPELDESEKNRLIASQKLISALKNKPLFKVLNSDNLAEYMTYNEETGNFDLYKGSLEDRKKRELHNAQLRQKYFPDDVRFDTHLIEEDPTRYRRNLMGNYFAGAVKNMKYAFLDVVQNPGKYAKAAGMAIVGAIPIVGDIVKAKSEEDLKAEYVTNREMISSAPNALKTCLDTFGIISMVDEIQTAQKAAEIMAQYEALSAAMADLSVIQTMENMKILEKASMKVSPAEVAMYMSEIVDSCKKIIQCEGDKTELRKQQQDQLAKGHERFARMMQQAFATTKIEQVNSIIDASTGVAKEIFTATCGFAGPFISLGADLVKDITKSVYTAVANGKKDKELLFSKEILGDVDIDKNALTDDDVQQVFREVTGIENFKAFADVIRVTDAIDMHRMLLKERENVNLPGVLHALGLKSAGAEKATVNFILEKLSGDKTDYRERIKNAIESKELEQMSGFKRWFKTLVGSIKDRFFGKRTGHIEYTADKQRQKMINEMGEEGAIRYDNARLLYDEYKKYLQDELKDGKSMDDIKHIKLLNRSDHFIQMLALTDAVQKMKDPSIYTEDIQIKPEKLKEILDSAIDECNEKIDGVIADARKKKQQELEAKEKGLPLEKENKPRDKSLEDDLGPVQAIGI